MICRLYLIFVTHKCDPAPTYSSVNIDPRLGSLLHQTAAVQQGAEQSSILGLCMGSACKQQSPFLNQTGEVRHHPDDNRVLGQKLVIDRKEHEIF